MMVYVLLEIEQGVERPVAVVTKEEVAEDFYQKNTKDRDWIPFNLDEVPMLTGEPSTPPQPTPQNEHLRRTQEAVNETRQKLDTMNERTKQVLEKLQQQRRSRK